MRKPNGNKSEKVVTVVLVLIGAFMVFLFARNFYGLTHHESLTFKIKTTYTKDGYSYTDEKLTYSRHFRQAQVGDSKSKGS